MRSLTLRTALALMFAILAERLDFEAGSAVNFGLRLEDDFERGFLALGGLGIFDNRGSRVLQMEKMVSEKTRNLENILDSLYMALGGLLPLPPAEILGIP